MIGHSPPNLGNADFKIGIGQARGEAIAILAASQTALPAGTNVAGVPLLIDLAAAAVVFVPLSGNGAGLGMATFKLPIPDNPSLRNIEMFAQWFVLDPNALGGIAATPAARFTTF